MQRGKVCLEGDADVHERGSEYQLPQERMCKLRNNVVLVQYDSAGNEYLTLDNGQVVKGRRVKSKD